MDINRKYIEALKHDIEDKYNRSFRSATDFDKLETLINSDSGRNETLNSSTLKRIWGYSKTTSKPRRTTLTILASVLGYRDWETYIEKKSSEQKVESGFLSNTIVNISQMMPGDIISFKWNPDRSISLLCREKEVFEVLEQKNSSLRPGDIVRLPFIREGYPIYCKDVIRDDRNLGDYVAGEETGIYGFKYQSNNAADPQS